MFNDASNLARHQYIYATYRCLKTAWELAFSCRRNSHAKSSDAALCLTCCREDSYQDDPDVLEGKLEIFFQFYKQLQTIPADFAEYEGRPGKIHDQWTSIRLGVQTWSSMWSSHLLGPRSSAERLRSMFSASVYGQLLNKISTSFALNFALKLMGNKIGITHCEYLANVPNNCE